MSESPDIGLALATEATTPTGDSPATVRPDKTPAGVEAPTNGDETLEEATEETPTASDATSGAPAVETEDASLQSDVPAREDDAHGDDVPLPSEAEAEAGAATDEAAPDAPESDDAIACSGTLPPGKSLTLTISRDRMEAFVVCDKNADVSDPERALEEMVAFLEGKNIVEIDRKALRNLIASVPTGASVRVSSGRQPVEGEDGEIVMEIEKDANVDERMKSLERIDYREMRRIDNVTVGTLLARMIPPTDGVDGFDVTGNVLRAKPGRPEKLVPGRNVRLSDDRLEVYATCDGIARTEGNRIVVDPVFKVSGSVDYVVGNIDFIGDVEIGGDVNPDFIVKARGSVSIGGNVDKACLQAQGDITIRGGLFGKDDAWVYAGNDVRLCFAENAIITAFNDVHASDSLMQCETRAGGRIFLTGSPVGCLGGRIVASRGIEASSLGSPRSEVRTIAQIEVDPRLQRMRRRWLAQLEAEDDPRRRVLLEAKIETADQQIAEQLRGDIIVHDAIYPGVEIIIGDVRYRPSSALCSVRFVLSQKSDEPKILIQDA